MGCWGTWKLSLSLSLYLLSFAANMSVGEWFIHVSIVNNNSDFKTRDHFLTTQGPLLDSELNRNDNDCSSELNRNDLHVEHFGPNEAMDERPS